MNPRITTNFATQQPPFNIEARNALLTPPECAKQLDDDVLSAYAEQAGDVSKLREDKSISSLLTLPRQLGPYSTVHYPFGGADTLFSGLMHDAEVEVLTGAEAFGNPHETAQAISLTYLDQLTGTAPGAYDSVMGWIKSDEVGCTDNTLGPLAIYRALAANDLLKKSPVSKINVASFTIDSKGNFLPKASEDGVNNNLAFWLTREDGTRKVVLYNQMYLSEKPKEPGAVGRQEINALHAFESRITPIGAMGILQKALPESLDGVPDAQHLTSPPEPLVKSIMSDVRNKENALRPVYVSTAKYRQSVDGIRIGYGNKLTIHTIGPVQLNFTNESRNLLKVEEHGTQREVGQASQSGGRRGGASSSAPWSR